MSYYMTRYYFNYAKVSIILTVVIIIDLIISVSSRPNSGALMTEIEGKTLDRLGPEVSNNKNLDVITESNEQYQLGYVDRPALEKICEKAIGCPSSKEEYVVCGSNGLNYQNIGILACAQLCNIELKFEKFGPCQKSTQLPLQLDAIPTRASVTRRGQGPQKRLLKELVEDSDIKEGEVVNYLKRRIQSRHKIRGFPPAVEDWCRENPTECPSGYDPVVNKEVYFIPAIPYNEKELYKKKF